jgi:acetyl-CoA carboxylase carboxyltransferase component
LEFSHPELVGELHRRRAAITDAGRAGAVARQHDLGKLSARERIALLCDDSGFREFGGLVGAARGASGTEQLDAPADGVVTGTGIVDGRPVVIMSFDYTVFGGSNGIAGGLKVMRCLEIAVRDGIPLVMLLDGGGHRIQEGLDSHHFAMGFEIFQEMVHASGYVLIIAVMLGPGFGGPSNFAALADYTVMVRGISTMGIAGPALVRAATGEQISKEDLGGADVQAQLGVTDLAVDTETEALDAVRVFLSYFPANSSLPPPRDADTGPGGDGQRLAEIVPANTRLGYDVRGVIEIIADAGTVFEIKEKHAPNIVTALIRLGGRPVGLIANQPLHLGGSLDSPACEKGAHMISMCDAFGLPLLFLMDIPGFLAGSESNTTQLARRSGRIIFELGQATVPLYTVSLRKGYGAGYMAMNGGRSYRADLALAWPSAEIAAMSVEGAVDIAYRRQVEQAADPAVRRAELIAQFRSNINAFAAAEGFGVDDLIDPAETRDVLLEALARAPVRHPSRAPRKTHAISPI